MQKNGMTRRESLVRTAAGLGLAVSMSLATKKAMAKVSPKPNAKTDNDVLNALLAAEYDAIATYTAGAGIIAGDVATPQATRDVVTDVAVRFQDQHKEHAAALKKLIEDNDGTPVEDSGEAKLP